MLYLRRVWLGEVGKCSLASWSSLQEREIFDGD